MESKLSWRELVIIIYIFWALLRSIDKFKVCKSVHYHTIQINQQTRCNNLSSVLLDVYVQLDMFRASLRP